MDRIRDKKPLVSVIVPAYNAGAFLHLTIDSVREQSYKNWELIIVNDGSKDNTRIIAEAYAARDKRIRVISQENQGVTAARRRGLTEAAGDWVFFLDADDLLDSEGLQASLEQPEDATLVFGNMVRMTRSRERLSCQSVSIGGLNSASLYPLIFSFKLPQTICGKLIRRSIADRIVWPNEQIRIGEDALAFFSVLPLCDKVYAFDRDCYYYIANEESTMSKKSPAAVASMRLYLDEITRFADSVAPELWPRSHRYVLLEYYAYLMYGGAWDREFVRHCYRSEELPLKVWLLFWAFKRSRRLGRMVRRLLRGCSLVRHYSIRFYALRGVFGCV